MAKKVSELTKDFSPERRARIEAIKVDDSKAAHLIGVLTMFYSYREALEWILAPQKLLGGEVPIELIRAGRIDDVLRLVDQLKDGVYV